MVVDSQKQNIDYEEESIPFQFFLINCNTKHLDEASSCAKEAGSVIDYTHIRYKSSQIPWWYPFKYTTDLFYFLKNINGFNSLIVFIEN